MVPMNIRKLCLVGDFNPFEKYARKIGSSPQVGVKNEKCLKPPPSYVNVSRYMYSTDVSGSCMRW